ncbi:hypothetical protein SEVIR_1G296100v4 [Setaria viridis]|uniref:Uncharacterized protein n=2 Tax=Setaria TaxID=4554 RepID=A0A368PR80_SETIT|nr:uncharacterized protein LOC101760191 [Setaria italica]XP_034570328.1 uncharacterized protein LOC117835074 [Setaria viridis]RCV08004.1 hypothetical protein SETIT_1G290900v2 [Setaria italica]TKW41165.1 hypothetical protein SEVIR_1G296100v2 [Setaria viridis]
MASLPDPTVYYPTSSNAILRAHPSTAASSKGSFGPVFAVLSVISVLAVAACVVGRLCGRRLSRKKAADHDFYGSDAVGGDLEKGFEVKYPPAMKPMASSRAMIHDIDDGFEIKFAPGKPAAWKGDGKADNNKGRQQQQQQHQVHHHQGHQPQPQLVGMMPKGYAVPKEYAGFRYPADAVVRQGQIRGGAFIPAKPST